MFLLNQMAEDQDNEEAEPQLEVQIFADELFSVERIGSRVPLMVKDNSQLSFLTDMDDS